MEIKYTLTEEDYLAFNMFHVKNSTTATKSLKWQRFLMPVLFIFFAYIFSMIVDISLVVSLITFFIVGLLWIVFYPKYFYSVVKRQTKKMIQEGENESLLGQHHLVMTEEGLIETTSSGETSISWKGIKKFTEDDDHFYLYNSGLSAIILPKRAVNNEEEIRTFILSKC